MISAATNPRPPGGTTHRIQEAINAAHVLLADHGIEISPFRVSRLVRKFSARAAANGWVFADYLSERIELSADQRRRLLRDPNLERIAAYLKGDPVGEEATHNLDQVNAAALIVARAKRRQAR